MDSFEKQTSEIVSRLVKASHAPAFLFDYDGTLAPFVRDRDAAVPYQGMAARLDQLRLVPGVRVIVVSGRPVSDVSRLLGLLPTPEVWGCHGWERRSEDGQRSTGELPERVRHVLERLELELGNRGLGSFIERKPASIALHWRGLTQAQLFTLRQEGVPQLLKAGEEEGLDVHRFDGGLELRLSDWDKGAAVRTVLAETPSGTPLIYFGDDLTDEDAFKALPQDGIGILVREEPRPTAARYWLRPPHELLHCLDVLLGQLKLRFGCDAEEGVAT